jgi:hypothetical protein
MVSIHSHRDATQWIAFCLMTPLAVCFATAGRSQDAERSIALECDWIRQAELRLSGADPMNESAPSGVTPEEDALGAVDGKITGEWGFHTENEEKPWWQVDLGEPRKIGRMVIYNRYGPLAARNGRMRMLISNDTESWRQVWQNDGTAFNTSADDPPLEVTFDDLTARFVRLQLPTKDYFHLDEVQIYAPKENHSTNSPQNLALGRSCTQSSVSRWSVKHSRVGSPRFEITPEVIHESLRRGRLLADHLQQQGVDVAQTQDDFDAVDESLSDLALDESGAEDRLRRLYFKARSITRRLAMRNPLLDFESIVFVKHAPSLFPHMSDQFYCWWQRGGGSLCLLKNFKTDPIEVNLTSDWPDGTFLRPDLSYDGQRILFAWARFYPELQHKADKTAKEEIPEDAFFHIFEMDLRSRRCRQLTHGRYDDFDARYLPDGDIVFLSTRKGTFLQTGQHSAASTLKATRPDSYVRCGGGRSRPVAVYTLHAMDGDGSNLRQISAFESFEWTPSIMNDGRVLYARWDYVDRFNGPFISLWATRPDGTSAQLLYGNYTKKPQCVFEARAIPGSKQVIFTASAHHSNVGGSLVLFDRTRGTEFEKPLERITPEVPFPETEKNVDHYYLNPYPLSEDHYLVAWSDAKLPAHHYIDSEKGNPSNSIGLYLYDRFGNLTFLHRDPTISCMNPIPLRSRPLPKPLPQRVDWQGPQEGGYLLQDVHEGLPNVEPGSLKRLRIIGGTPKVQPEMNQPMLGVSREEPGKFILGTVPIEEDGSAFFRVPSGVPYFFQVLDEEGLAVQTMRSMTYVQPGETVGCIGCHESREAAPMRKSLPLAARREPSTITPAPEGTWPLRFDRLVQPVLDEKCVSCHRGDSEDRLAAALPLTPDKSYDTLMSFDENDLHRKAFERDRSIPGETTARNSRLYQLLTDEPGHAGVQLDAEEMRRLVTWMDTYAHKVGSFSLEQEKQLLELRRKYLDLLSDTGASR